MLPLSGMSAKQRTNCGNHADKKVYWKVFTYCHTITNVSTIVKLTSVVDFRILCIPHSICIHMKNAQQYIIFCVGLCDTEHVLPWFTKLWYVYHYQQASHCLLVCSLNKKNQNTKRIIIFKSKWNIKSHIFPNNAKFLAVYHQPFFQR